MLAQTGAYCAAVGVLCVTARQLIRTRAIANATVVVVVLIAIQARFALWNTQILSESLGLSLGIMVVAMWWRAAAASSPRRVTWAWAWTVVWLLERDAHTVPIVVVLVPVAAAIGWRVRSLPLDVRRRLVAGSMVALVVCGYVYTAQQVSHRNRYSLYNTIGMRVLNDPPLRDWFVSGGMPLDAALLGRKGKTAFDDNRFFVDDPSLERFRRWADGPGGRRMVLSLVVRAPDWFRLQGEKWAPVLAYDYDAYDSYGVVDRLPTEVPFQLGGPRTPDALRIWLLVATGAACFATTRAKRRGLAAFSMAGLCFVLVELYTTLAADPLEAERHLVGPVNRLAVILAVCVAIGADALWQARLPVPGVDQGGDLGHQ